MVELQINTTQNVNINFIAASVGERILAYIIDLVIKIAYVVFAFQIVFNVLEWNTAIELIIFRECQSINNSLRMPVNNMLHMQSI